MQPYARRPTAVLDRSANPRGKLNSTFRTLGPHLSHTGGQLASREPEGSANRINVRFPDFCLSLARFDLYQLQ